MDRFQKYNVDIFRGDPFFKAQYGIQVGLLLYQDMLITLNYKKKNRYKIKEKTFIFIKNLEDYYFDRYISISNQIRIYSGVLRNIDSAERFPKILLEKGLDFGINFFNKKNKRFILEKAGMISFAN